MNNENKEFFINDVENNISEEEIVLASPTELYDEAKDIAQNTKSDEKFPFALQYDANQKEFLLSLLQTVGAIVEDDDEESHVLSTQMNMTQLAFIKRLESVERVRTDEGRNPFLMEAAEQPATVAETPVEAVAPQTAEAMQTEQVMTLAADEMVAVAAEPAMANANNGIAVACVGGSSSSCSCPTNKDMASAQEIKVETLVSGKICCPGAEQWFKFTVPETKEYTIFTTGTLDTEGELSGCCLATPITNDDYAGRVNFRIVKTLCAGYEYYIKVSAKNDATGSYTLKVTEKTLAKAVLIHPNRSDGVIVLERGKTYELPNGEGYGFLNVANTEKAELSVQIDPDTTTDKRVIWSASSIPSDLVDTNTAWYDNTTSYQTITANRCGGTKLYAYDWNGHGKRGEAYVAVIPRGGSLVKATGISLDYTFLTMDIGDNQKIVATVSPSTATVTDVDWESDNPSVATVTPYGRVKAIAPGIATIRAKAMDGSGVYGCCTVTCNLPSSGTDSISVFQTLSAIGTLPGNTETGVPVIAGVQFTEPQNGKYNIRFVSLIKTLNYQSVGYEIHSKFDEAAPVSNILCPKVAYKWLWANGEKIHPDEGFDYFVACAVEDIPQNTVAFFKIVPYAITFGGEYLHGNTTLFRCKGAQMIDSVDFETSTSNHTRVNTGNGSNLNVMSLPGENGTVLGQFADGKEIDLVHETPQNEKWYHVHGEMVDGSFTCGWCSGEYLEQAFDALTPIKNCYVRTNTIINDSTLLRTYSGYSVILRTDRNDKVRLLQKDVIIGGSYQSEDKTRNDWYKIEYNGEEAFVTADSFINSYLYYPLIKNCNCGQGLTPVAIDDYITSANKDNNAKIVYGYLYNKGWSKKAICAVLGNMEAESDINPGFTQRSQSGHKLNAYGLVQWDSIRSDMEAYMDKNGKEYDDLYAQLDCLDCQCMDGSKYWNQGSSYPSDLPFPSFHSFKNDSDFSIEVLTRVFIWAFEKPGIPAEQTRIGYANKWYEFFKNLGY